MKLDKIVNLPRFGQFPAPVREEMMRRAVDTARESARSKIMMDDYRKNLAEGTPKASIIIRAKDAKVGVEMGKKP